jgi:hypothetical protein
MNPVPRASGDTHASSYGGSATTGACRVPQPLVKSEVNTLSHACSATPMRTSVRTQKHTTAQACDLYSLWDTPYHTGALAGYPFTLISSPHACRHGETEKRETPEPAARQLDRRCFLTRRGPATPSFVLNSVSTLPFHPLNNSEARGSLCHARMDTVEAPFLGEAWQGSLGSMDMDEIYLQMTSTELEVPGGCAGGRRTGRRRTQGKTVCGTGRESHAPKCRRPLPRMQRELYIQAPESQMRSRTLS